MRSGPETAREQVTPVPELRTPIDPVGERTRIINRIKGALARLGIRDFKPTLRSAPQLLETLRTPEGDALPPNTLAELRRDMARLGFVKQQIKEVETARLERLQRAPGEPNSGHMDAAGL